MVLNESWEYKNPLVLLTHSGRVTHICVGNLTIIGSDNGLSPGRRKAIIWTNAGILLIGPLGTNFSEILIGIHKLSFTKNHLKMSSAKWRSFSLGLNVLNAGRAIQSLALSCQFHLQTITFQNEYQEKMTSFAKFIYEYHAPVSDVMGCSLCLHNLIKQAQPECRWKGDVLYHHK